MMPFGINAFLKAITDAVFPIQCVGCSRDGHYLCEDCQQEVLDPKQFVETEVLAACSYANPVVQKALHQYKYQYVEKLAEPLGAVLQKCLQQYYPDPGKEFDAIVPIPLHSQRLRQRGFNQTLLLCRSVGDTFSIPVVNGIERVRATKPQASLGHDQRQDNVADAFKAVGGVEGKRLLLIDDVYTTGSTIAQARDALLQAGAQTVTGLVVAHG